MSGLRDLGVILEGYLVQFSLLKSSFYLFTLDRGYELVTNSLRSTYSPEKEDLAETPKGIYALRTYISPGISFRSTFTGETYSEEN